MVATISPGSLADLRRRGDGVTLIDVRTPAEYDEVHVDGARNIPLDRLDPRAIAAEHAGKTGSPLYFVCKSGGRSQKACEQMIAAGINDVVSVEGGTSACEAVGMKVARSGRKVMSLERQVRICAGGLVVLGAVLGHFVNPAWHGLSAFIGAGLVFARLAVFGPQCRLLGVDVDDRGAEQLREPPELGALAFQCLRITGDLLVELLPIGVRQAGRPHGIDPATAPGG
jgi:rhodanese-related sulfurtransferase